MNENMNETDRYTPEQPNTSYHFTASQLPTEEASSSASFGSGSWENSGSSRDNPPPKKKKSGIFLKIIAAILCLALVGGVSFGAGYAGVMKAKDSKAKVVIQQVTTNGEAPETKTVNASVLSGVEIAEKVERSVVAITTEIMKTNYYWNGNHVISGAGSGVVISEDGYILTCAHVINGASKITVELMDGSTYNAQVVGKYVDGDIAVIKIDATGLTPADIADSDTVKQGSVCYAVGNPEGQFSGSISEGIVSSLGRSITVQVENEADNQASTQEQGQGLFPGNGFFGGFGGNSLYDMFFNMQSGGYSAIDLDVIQMTAAVSPGNSGGALFNDRGQLIGIVSAKIADSDSEGLGFAIPSNNAVEIASQIIANGEYIPSESELDSEEGVTNTTNKAILGITVSTVDSEAASQYGMNPGVYVQSVTAESTAQAGLAVGDRIISIDDVMVSTTADITGYLADKEPGDSVKLNVEREGKLVSMDIELVENK